MPRVPLAVVVGVLALTGALAGCTQPAGTPTRTATIPAPSGDGILRIGTIFSTTGADSTDAAAQTAAVNAALREIGASGVGLPVEVVNRNGGTAGDGLAEAAFADLAARGVDAIIGPSSAEIAAIVAPLAVAAGIPLISASDAGDRPAGTSPGYWRSIPPVTGQAAALRTTLGDDAVVAVLRADDATGAAWAAGVAADVDVVIGADPAADAAELAAVNPDAVVIATADAGEATAAVLGALPARGIAGESIWIVGRSLGAYPTPGVLLRGARGLAYGSSGDGGFLLRVRAEDPGVPGLRYAAEAYDAVMLVALAAALAGDDGAASIAATLSAVPDGGIPCTSYGACMDVLRTETDIAYAGPSGAFRFDQAGDRVGGAPLTYTYDATGAPVLTVGAR